MPLALKKINAVYLVGQAVRRGELTPQPCQVCGENPVNKNGSRGVHAHHDDYDKPLEVIWLCALHHGQIHRVMREEEINLPMPDTLPESSSYSSEEPSLSEEILALMRGQEPMELKNMENEIRVGDVVQLKSGGPPMTVGEIQMEFVRCQWFDSTGVHHLMNFNPRTLTKTER
jgi:uncharacterized protein YodC (DUF2158 family)